MSAGDDLSGTFTPARVRAGLAGPGGEVLRTVVAQPYRNGAAHARAGGALVPVARRRSALTADDVAVRIADLLRADATCKGQVDKRTVRAIAEIVAYPEPVVDGDVAAEREACAVLVSAAAARLETQVGDEPDCPIALEALRLREAATSIRLGLHRGGTL